MDMITSELFGWFRLITTLYLADGEMMRFWLLLVKSIINQVMREWTDNSESKQTCAVRYEDSGSPAPISIKNLSFSLSFYSTEGKLVICDSDAELATIPNMARLISTIFNCILIWNKYKNNVRVRIFYYLQFIIWYYYRNIFDKYKHKAITATRRGKIQSRKLPI